MSNIVLVFVWYLTAVYFVYKIVFIPRNWNGRSGRIELYRQRLVDFFALRHDDVRVLLYYLLPHPLVAFVKTLRLRFFGNDINATRESLSRVYGYSFVFTIVLFCIRGSDFVLSIRRNKHTYRNQVSAVGNSTRSVSVGGFVRFDLVRPHGRCKFNRLSNRTGCLAAYKLDHTI